MEQRRHEEIQARLERLAATHAPGDLMDGLLDVAEELASAGDPQQDLYEDLRCFLHELRATGRREYEDDVLEAMDVVSGRCAPSARIYKAMGSFR